MRVALSLALALLTCTPAARGMCALTDSEGAEILSATGLRWQRLCTTPYEVVRPDAASTGRWMARSTQWTQDFVNRSKPGEADKVSYPACGASTRMACSSRASLPLPDRVGLPAPYGATWQGRPTEI